MKERLHGDVCEIWFLPGKAMFELLETRFQLHVRSYNDDEIGAKELKRFFGQLQPIGEEVKRCVLLESKNLTKFEDWVVKTTQEMQCQARQFCIDY